MTVVQPRQALGHEPLLPFADERLRAADLLGHLQIGRSLGEQQQDSRYPRIVRSSSPTPGIIVRPSTPALIVTPTPTIQTTPIPLPTRHPDTAPWVEERIDAIIAEKRQMAEEVLATDGEVNLTELPDDELMQLVRLDVTRATM